MDTLGYPTIRVEPPPPLRPSPPRHADCSRRVGGRGGLPSAGLLPTRIEAMRYAICVAMSRLMRPIVADATAVGAAPLPAVRSEAGGGVRASQVWALLPVGSAACGLSQVCASLCEPVQACAERRSECGGPWRRRRVRLTTIGSTCDGAGEVSTLVDMAMGAQCTSSPSRPVQACASLCKPVQACAKRWSECDRAWRRRRVRFTTNFRTGGAVGGDSRTQFGRYARGVSMRLSSPCRPV